MAWHKSLQLVVYLYVWFEPLKVIYYLLKTKLCLTGYMLFQTELSSCLLSRLTRNIISILKWKRLNSLFCLVYERDRRGCFCSWESAEGG